MKKLTFKQYLESKKQLLDAVNNVPTAVIEYQITKYCTLPYVDEGNEEHTLNLGPKNKILIEWTFYSDRLRLPTGFTVINSPNIDPEDVLQVIWETSKLDKWILRYTKDAQNTLTKT